MKLHSYRLIVLVLLISIMLFGMASAWDNTFNNVKDYNEQTSTVTISDNYVVNQVAIVSATLATPHINPVIPGLDRLVAKLPMKIDSDSYTNLISQVATYNKDTMQPINRPITLKYLVEDSPLIEQVTKYNCGIPTGTYYENGTEILSCESYLENKTTEQFHWIILTNDTFVKGNITIGLFADVYEGDNVEWIPTIAGLTIPEYATWTSSFNDGLVHYYSFNDAGDGTALDSTGKRNGFVSGTIANMTGKNGSAYSFDGTSAQPKISMESTITPANDGDNFTINLWAYPNSPITGSSVAQKIVTGSTFWMIWGAQSDFVGCSNTGNWWELGYANSGGSHCTNGGGNIHWLDSRWQMVTITQNASGTNIYVNGTLYGSNSLLLNANTANLTIGGKSLNDWTGPDRWWKGGIDEVAVWNRTLSSSEISDLYNSGTGIFYVSGIPPTFPINISASLIYPVKGYNSSLTTLGFSGNATISNGNISAINLTIDGVSVNSTAFSNVNYTTFNITYNALTEGLHNWSVNVCGVNETSTLCSGEENRSFRIDLSAPKINITYPSEDQNFTASNITVQFSVSDPTLNNTCKWSQDYGVTNNSVFCVVDNANNPSLLTTGLIHYYPMDDAGSSSTADSAGNRNASVIGSFSSMTGHTGNAYNFTGDGSYISLESAIAPFNNSDNFAISFWAYPTGNPDGSSVFQKRSSSSDFYMLWSAMTGVCSNVGQLVDFGYTNTGASYCTAQNDLIDTAWVQNKWQMVTVVQNSTGVTLYINSTYIASSNNVKAFNSTGNLTIGNASISAWAGVGVYWKGGIDDFAVWNRVLNSTDVQTLYNNGISFLNTNSFAITATQGRNNVTVFASDIVGHANSSVVHFNVDSSSPNIQFVSPTEANGTTVSSIDIKVNVTAFDSNLANITINVYNQSGFVSFTNTSTTSPFYQSIILPDGIYTFNATAYDIYGNSNSTETRTVTVNSNRPRITITYPNNGQNITTTLINSTFTINTTSSSTCKYSLNLGATNVSILCSDGSFVFTASQGLNTLTDYIVDFLGNANYSSVNFSVDSILPNVKFVSPTPASGSQINIQSVQINVTATDTNYANMTLYVYLVNGTLIKSNFTTSNNLYVNYTLSEGTYYFNATAYDTFGNVNFTEVRNFTIDVTPPNITISSPVNFVDYGYIGKNVSITYNISHPGGAIDTCLLTVYGGNLTSGTSTVYPLSCSGTSTSMIITTNQFRDGHIPGCFSAPETPWVCQYLITGSSILISANDTFGNIGTANSTWSYRLFENSIGYNNNVTAGQLNTITASFTTTAAPTSITLHYNGTSYSPTISSIGSDTYVATASVYAPAVPVTQNISFYYVAVVSGVTIQTNSRQQTVQTINLSTSCSPGTYQFINITNFDEETLNSMNGTVEFTLDLTSNNVVIATTNGTATGTNVAFCSDQNLTASTANYNLQLRYYAPNYLYKTYNVLQGSTSDLPIRLNLYYLNNTAGFKFNIYYQDFNYLTHPGALIQIQRQYLNLNTYNTVEIPITDSSGTAQGSFDTNNIRYKIIVIDGGVVIDTFENIFPVCQNIVLGQCNLYLRGQQASTTPTTTTGNDFDYTLVRTDTSLILTYTIPSGTPKTVQFLTDQFSRFLNNISDCNQVIFASGGTITCPYNLTVGDSLINAQVLVNGNQSYSGQILVPENANASFGLNNYFIAFVLVLLLGLIFMSSGMMIVIAAVVGVLFLGLVFLINGTDLISTGLSVVWLIIAALLIIYKISQKEEHT